MLLFLFLLLQVAGSSTLHLINNPAPSLRECQSVGKWVKMKHRPLISNGADNIAGWHTGCFFAKGDPMPPAQYAWIPPCPFRSLGPCRDPEKDECALDVERMCEIMGGRDLLLVGDSTQFTLHNILLSKLTPAQPEFHEHMHACPSYVFQCRTPFRLRFVRNDHLAWRQVDFDRLWPVHTLNNMRPWMHFVDKNTVVFMNRGSHPAPTVEVVATLRDTLSELQRRGARVVYRNTAIPMAMALRTDEPRNATPPLVIEHDYWGWDLIVEQNKVVPAMLATEFPWVTLIDVAYMSGFRTDSHIDPVHYCHPGAADWYWPLFFDSLL